MVKRIFALILLAAIGVRPSSTLTEVMPLKPAKQSWRGLHFHDFLPVEFAYTAMGGHSRLRFNILGISGGHLLMDLASTMPLLGIASFHGGDGLISALGTGSTLAALGTAFLVDKVDSPLEKILLAPVVLLPYALNPEVRLLPLFPVTAYAGYAFDLLYEERFRPIHALRGGLGFQYRQVRLRVGTDRTFYRGEDFLSYSLGLAWFMGDFDSVRGF